MNRAKSELFLPHSYEEQMNQGDLAERYERQVQALTSREFVEDMPSRKFAGGGKSSIAFHEAPNPDMGATEEVDTLVVHIAPDTTGYTPLMHARALAVVAFLPETERARTRVVTVPHNTGDRSGNYVLTSSELRDPTYNLAGKIWGIPKYFKAKRTAIIGDGWGAVIGARMFETAHGDNVDEIESIPYAVLGGSADIRARTEGLRGDVTDSGMSLSALRQLIAQGVNDSGIPALSELRHSRGELSKRKFRAATRLEQNHALQIDVNRSPLIHSLAGAYSDDPRNLVSPDMLPVRDGRLMIVRTIGSIGCNREMLEYAYPKRLGQCVRDVDYPNLYNAALFGLMASEAASHANDPHLRLVVNNSDEDLADADSFGFLP